MPVGRVARQARDLQSHHDSGASQAHLGDQVLEAFAIDGRGARVPEVRIDDDHLIEPPSQCNGALAQVVLTLGALGVLKHLPQRRLAHVEISVSLKVSSLYFRGSLDHHALSSSAVANAIVATMSTKFCSMPTGSLISLPVAGTRVHTAASPTHFIQAAIPLNMNSARPRSVRPPPPPSRTSLRKAS